MSGGTAPLDRRDELLPAVVVLALGMAGLVLRPALPVDETRYLEVFRESGLVLLRLEGQPYAEKPPLLFWLARMLTMLAVHPGFALRSVPVLASAVVVLLAARTGRALGVAGAGWVQAALLLPLVGGQVLLFDALLAAAVWGAVLAWIRGRDVLLVLAAAAALLAKGPVALLFLVAFLWSTADAAARPRALRRASLALALALVPLAAWALTAAALGGPDFASALLWQRWAGRMAGETDHARSALFYVPVVLLGALPATPLLLRRAGPSSRPVRRLGYALLALLAAFTLFTGKQAHYLLPAMPAVGLIVAWRLERTPAALAGLRIGAGTQLGLLVCAGAACILALPRLETSPTIGAHGQALLASGAWRWPVAAGGSIALAALALSMRRTLAARQVLAATLAGSGACLLAFHWLAGELLYPHDLAGVLGATRAPLAHVGTSHHGVYSLLADRSTEKLRKDELGAWCRAHPGGVVMIDSRASVELPAGLDLVALDAVHRSPVRVLRVRAAEMD